MWTPGTMTLYHPNKFPLGAIAPVSFLWKHGKVEGKKKLWLWVHPAAYEELLDALVTIFPPSGTLFSHTE